MDHYKHPRNRGTFDDDHINVEMNNPTCGDRIQLQFKLDGDIVEDVQFTGEGCSISLASASMMTQAIKGKKIEEALYLSELFSRMMLGKKLIMKSSDLEDIEALQGVANFPARIKCATLSMESNGEN